MAALVAGVGGFGILSIVVAYRAGGSDARRQAQLALAVATPASPASPASSAATTLDGLPSGAPASEGNAAAGGALVSKNDCVACHKTDVKLVGPSYQEIANRYVGDATAPARLVQKIRVGGSGNWGAIAMVPHPSLTDQQLSDMTAWVLAQRTISAVVAAGASATTTIAASAPVEYRRPVMGPIAFVDAAAVPSSVGARHRVAPLGPLPEAPTVDAARAELGRLLFFDPRLSGDATVSCSSCHDPSSGFGDGKALGDGYPGSLYFRNTPTLINATLQQRFLWDGRLDGGDPATLVRDMITEAHTMNMDGRLMQERVKQVPEYLARWRAIFGDEDPYGPRIFTLVGEYLKTIRSRNVPFDQYLAGAASALSESAVRGLTLFQGKANCIACHGGPLLSDGQFRATGVPENPEIARDPLRAITMLRHYSTFGVPNYMRYRTDVGLYAVTKARGDEGRFRTAPLRELAYTAPYMHNGVFATLEDVVNFYDAGGGAGPNKDPQLTPLHLTAYEKQDLLAFLGSLSGDPVGVGAAAQPSAYQRRPTGRP